MPYNLLPDDSLALTRAKPFHFINCTPCIRHASVSSVSACMQEASGEAHVYAHKETCRHTYLRAMQSARET